MELGHCYYVICTIGMSVVGLCVHNSDKVVGFVYFNDIRCHIEVKFGPMK